jgi:hypothetical protein
MPFTSPLKRRVSGGGTAPAAGSSGSGGTGDTGAAPAPGGATPGYVDFSRILSANRAGAQGMASQLAGRVQQQGQQAAGAISTAQQGFENKVKQGTLTHQPSYNVTRGPAMAGGAGASNPYFQAGQQAGPGLMGYQGPKDWQGAGIDTQALERQSREAGDAAKNLTTQGGRGAMLREQARGPYTAGMSTLDSALAGAALGSRDEDLAAQYGSLSQRLADARAASGKSVDAATAASNQAAQGFKDDQAMWDRLQQSPPGALTTPQAPTPGHATDYMATPGASYAAGPSPTTPPPSPNHRWIPGRGWVL